MHDTSEEVLGNARTDTVEESPVHVGLDVHKESIAPAAVRKLVDRLSADARGSLRFVYEAGPCGYALLRRLRGWDLTCDLIAPSQIPRKAGDRVKTDRRDARELARLSMMGYLQPLWVPDPGQEAVRDLVRLRMSLKESIRRAQQRIGHFLLRQDKRWGKPNWTAPHRAWMKDLKFEQSAHRVCLSSSLAVLEDLERRLNEVGLDLQRKAANASDYARERAWAAQKRLCRRYQEFLKRGTNVKTAVSAIARELAGFVWDIACHEMRESNSE